MLERIRELRAEKGYTMYYLANKIGVSDAAISNWENGVNEPKANYIVKLANVFDVTADYLLGRSNDMGLIEIAADLSDDEQELINQYRKLSVGDKSQLLALAKRFLS